jgi:hypothetical protein
MLMMPMLIAGIGEGLFALIFLFVILVLTVRYDRILSITSDSFPFFLGLKRITPPLTHSLISPSRYENISKIWV